METIEHVIMFYEGNMIMTDHWKERNFWPKLLCQFLLSSAHILIGMSYIKMNVGMYLRFAENKLSLQKNFK